MSYDTKIASAKDIISSHNSTVGEDAQVNFDEFLACLQKEGGTTEQALKKVSFEDLQACGLPRILARTVADAFRGKDDTPASGAQGYVSERKAAGMSIRELLERYDPAEDDTHVAKRLKAISKGEPCIVFTNDGKIDIDKSVQLIEDLKEGLPALEKVIGGDGLPTVPRKIGDRPDRFFHENPLFPGQALRNGEMCSQTSRSWEGVDIRVRQLLRLARDNGEIRLQTTGDVMDVLDRVVIQKADFASLAQRYPNAAIKFAELEKTNNLPNLRISIGSDQVGSNNPFGSGKNRSY